MKIRGNGKEYVQHSVKQRMATLLLLPVTIPIFILASFFALRNVFTESVVSYSGSQGNPSSQTSDFNPYTFLAIGFCLLVCFVVRLLKRRRYKEPVTATATYIAEEDIYFQKRRKHSVPPLLPRRVWVVYYKYYYNGYCGYTNCKAFPI